MPADVLGARDHLVTEVAYLRLERLDLHGGSFALGFECLIRYGARISVRLLAITLVPVFAWV